MFLIHILNHIILIIFCRGSTVMCKFPKFEYVHMGLKYIP